MRHSYVGRKDQPPGYRFETEDYDQRQIIYVMTGSLDVSALGPLEGETRTALLRPGSVLSLVPGAAFTLSSSTGYEGVFRLAPKAERGSCEDEPREGIVDLVRWATSDRPTQEAAGLLLHEITAPGHNAEAVLDTMGALLATVAYRCIVGQSDSLMIPEHGVDDAAFRTRRAQQIIDSHLYSNRGVRNLLGSLGRSYRQIARDFTRIMGVTPKEYQVQSRITEAERLLSGSRSRITDIALDLGYPSSQHFAAQFRQATGRTPSEYRSQSVTDTPKDRS